MFKVNRQPRFKTKFVWLQKALHFTKVIVFRTFAPRCSSFPYILCYLASNIRALRPNHLVVHFDIMKWRVFSLQTFKIISSYLLSTYYGPNTTYALTLFLLTATCECGSIITTVLQRKNLASRTPHSALVLCLHHLMFLLNLFQRFLITFLICHYWRDPELHPWVLLFSVHGHFPKVPRGFKVHLCADDSKIYTSCPKLCTKFQA